MSFGFGTAFTRPTSGLIPALQLQFAGAEVLDSRITFTRASAGTRFNSAGLMETIGYNQIPNSLATGGTAGIFGSGGVQPTNWGASPPSGITQTFSFGTVDGVPYVECRFFGTSTVLGDCVIDPVLATLGPTASFGQAWSAQIRVALMAGAWPSRPVTLNLYERNAGGGFLDASVFDVRTTATGPTLVPVSVIRSSFIQATVARASLGFRAALQVGDTVDFTVRLASPQLEQNATTSTYSPTTTAANSAPRFDYDPATPAGVTGPELLADPSFDNPSDWTLFQPTSGAALVANGVASVVSLDGTYAAVQASLSTPASVAGRTYFFELHIASISGGQGLAVEVGGISSAAFNTPGLKTGYVTAGSSARPSIKRGGSSPNSGGVVTAFFVREATFAPRGLLIEEARTNLLLHSRDMTQAAWSKTDVTAARTQVGIDGVANTACLMTEGVLGTSGTIQTVTTTATQTHTLTRYLKRGNTDWIRMAFVTSPTSNGGQAWFNLGTGVKGTVSVVGSGTNPQSSMVSIGGGYFRCAVTATVADTDVSMLTNIYCAASDNSSTRVNNGTYIADAAQLEVGAFPTSFIPTTTAAATRAADSAVMTGTNFSSWYNQTEGTMIGAFTRFGFDGVAGSATILAVDDNTANNRIYLRVSPRAASTGAQGTIVVGGVVGANDVMTAVDITGASQKYGLAYQVGVGSLARNGGAAFPLTSVASLPTVSQLQIGTGYSGVPLNGHIRSIKYFKTRLPNATLQGLTA